MAQFLLWSDELDVAKRTFLVSYQVQNTGNIDETFRVYANIVPPGVAAQDIGEESIADSILDTSRLIAQATEPAQQQSLTIPSPSTSIGIYEGYLGLYMLTAGVTAIVDITPDLLEIRQVNDQTSISVVSISPDTVGPGDEVILTLDVYAGIRAVRLDVAAILAIPAGGAGHSIENYVASEIKRVQIPIVVPTGASPPPDSIVHIDVNVNLVEVQDLDSVNPNIPVPQVGSWDNVSSFTLETRYGGALTGVAWTE